MASTLAAGGLAFAMAGLAGAAPGGGADSDHGRNWPSYGGDFTEDHFSPLTAINDHTIGRLGLAWFYDLDARPNAFSAPLAVDGVLYFGAGYSVLHAMDARTGRLLWRFDPRAAEAAGEKMRGAWGIRGIAYAEGRLFAGTIDGRLLAVDARTGRLLWSVMTVDPHDGRYITGPPWVFNGKVVIGHGGADFAPVRGYVTAYAAASGHQLWRFYTVPGDPAKGFENAAMAMAAKTWTGEWWKFGGGGTVWNAMAYDPRFNRVYIGVGNGAPWNRKIRSPGGGDNLFLASIVALDADTGAYVWHYQVNPGESWDYVADMDIELADLAIGGRMRPVILHAPKNGFFYVIDRETGRLISAEKFVPTVNWAERIDPASGRPVEIPAARFPDGRPFLMYPSPVGAHSVEAMSFNPGTGLAYIPAIEQGRVYVDPPGGVKDWQFTPGEVINNGIGRPPPSMQVPPGSNALLAWDPVRQRAAWSVPLPGPKNGATMTTAGNLVFQGNIRGELVAYGADSGTPLWTFDAQNGVMAQPITYLAGGRQYVTVLTGWRLSTSPGPGLEWDYVQQKRRVLTFALDAAATLPPADRSPRPFLDDPAFVVDPAQADLGATVFASRCSICHGAELRAGGAAPELRKSGVPLAVAGLYAVLHDGALVHNGMPRFAELSAAEIAGLQHYIRRQARAALAGGGNGSN